MTGVESRKEKARATTTILVVDSWDNLNWDKHGMVAHRWDNPKLDKFSLNWDKMVEHRRDNLQWDKFNLNWDKLNWTELVVAHSQLDSKQGFDHRQTGATQMHGKEHRWDNPNLNLKWGQQQ